jgi:hypothetical protein
MLGRRRGAPGHRSVFEKNVAFLVAYLRAALTTVVNADSRPVRRAPEVSANLDRDFSIDLPNGFITVPSNICSFVQIL